MKKTFRLLATVAIAATLLAGCNNDITDNATIATDDSSSFLPLRTELVGVCSTTSSRTAIIDGQKVVWSPDDKVGIFAPGIYATYWKLSSRGSKMYSRKELLNFPLVASAAGEASALLATAPEAQTSSTYTNYDGWQWKVAKTDDPATRTFYAYYPYNEAKAFTNYTNWDGKFPFRLAEEQTQSAADDASHIAAYDMLWGKATFTKPDDTADKSEFADKVALNFAHLFSLLEYTVVNETDKPLTVKTITLDGGTTAIAGGYQIDAETDAVEWTSSVPNICLNCGSEGFTLAAGASFKAYMIAAPATLTDAAVKVATDAGEQSFAVNAAFKAGKRYTKRLAITATQTTYTLATVDFEDILSSGQSKFLADSAFGNNIDGKVTNGYQPYKHAATGLVVSLNYGAYQPDLYPYHRVGGGFWGSNYNDMTTNGVMNHSSVYYSDAATGKGGHNGSEYFAVCYESTSGGMSLTNAQIYFENASEEHVFDHIWVNNTTWAVLDMEGADGALNEPFTYSRRSWCKLMITGVRADGTESGTVEFYLADFRTDDAKGIVKEWTKIDLSALGSVAKLRFSMDSSDVDEFLGARALNNPAYFCIDDLTVRM